MKLVTETLGSPKYYTPHTIKEKQIQNVQLKKKIYKNMVSKSLKYVFHYAKAVYFYLIPRH